MFPSQLRGLPAKRQRSLSTSVIPSTTLRTSFATTQGRSFWGWRRAREDWSSHIDPAYSRFNRYRTLKTKAKLLANLRRRARFDWDVEQKPFFTPKHIRWASHWMGRPPPSQRDDKHRNGRDGESVEVDGRNGRKAEEDGYELSEREKLWKEQMERLRKRIEQDPYEVVFGKRFEPFWGPLVPSWMREEMGLQGWPKSRDAATAQPSEVAAKQSDAKPKRQEPKTAETDESKRQTAVGARPESVRSAQQLGSYSYCSTTSWDSQTQKARRRQWDSVSGEIRKYEYDPISNRMIPIEAPLANEPAVLEPAFSSEMSTGPQAKKSSVSLETTHPKTVDIPVKSWDVKKTASNLRKSIPIPPPARALEKRPVRFSPPAPTTTVKNTALSKEPPRPAALPNILQSDLDLLTAEDVRAKMGKTKSVSNIPPTSLPREQLECSFEPRSDFLKEELKQNTIKVGKVKASLDRWQAATAKREAAEQAKANEQRAAAHGKTSAKSEWDQAELGFLLKNQLDGLKRKKEKLLRSENGLFHIERQKRELQKLDERMREVADKLKLLEEGTKSAFAPKSVSSNTLEAARVSSLVHGAIMGDSILKKEAEIKSVLQPALERMQSKELCELDDSAAHECTEPIATLTNIPSDWSNQADLLQAERVKRTASKRQYPMTRWLDDMNARKTAYDASQVEKKPAEAERNAKFEKANRLLEAEVLGQKLAMSQHEARYAHKIRSLRQDLETAYKQSSVHADEFRDSIARLQKELEQAKQASDGEEARHTKRYALKTKALREELEGAYKQSSVYADEYMERIKKLEVELERTQKAIGEGKPAPKSAEQEAMKEMQGEGDFCTNITKYAGSDKWYKQPAAAFQPQNNPKKAEQASQKARDQALVRDVREIYEERYGPIDVEHRQPVLEPQKSAQKTAEKGVVEVESDVDLGEALAEHEKTEATRFKQDGLEAEIAQQEKEAHEAQGLMPPESSGTMKENRADFLSKDGSKGHKVLFPDIKSTLDGLLPPPAAELANSTGARAQEAVTPPEPAATHNVQWEAPPLYKVLAYDAGNDMLTTATTTSNVTDTETPISIQQALSELYQPARFVPHFAALQQEGYQVIFGTKDLLVLRKVRAGVEPVTSTLTEERQEMVDRIAAESSPAAAASVNPVDGTERHYAEPLTGNFASPTGFVNHDPVFPTESPVTASETVPSAKTVSAHKEELAGIEAEIPGLRIQTTEPAKVKDIPKPKSTRKVKREERVFSGVRKSERTHWRNEKRQERKSRIEYRRRLRRVILVTLGVAFVVYAVGDAVEESRKADKHRELLEGLSGEEREKWQGLLEGKAGKWNLDEGAWKR